MKKRFKNKGSKKEKRGNKPQVQPENKNRINFNTNESYLSLESYSAFTNWSLNDFVTILALTDKVVFPVTVTESVENTFHCKDANDTPFTFTLKYSLLESRSNLTLEKGNETYTYGLKNKLSPRDVPSLQIINYKKVVDDKTFGFSLAENNLQLEFMLLTKDNLFYNVKINLLDAKKKDILYKILNNTNLENVFEKLDDSASLLKDATQKLQLTEEELAILDVVVSFAQNEVIYSKVNLFKNKIIEYIFTNEEGTFYLFQSGCFSFHSADKGFTITINDLKTVSNDTLDKLKSFDKIKTFARTLLEKIESNTLA